MFKQLPQSAKAILDYKKRAILFAKTLQEGVSKEYKREIKEHKDKAEYLEKNL